MAIQVFKPKYRVEEVLKEIRTFNVEGMWGLGTPEDLNEFLKNK